MSWNQAEIIFNYLAFFVFAYPLGMSIIWMVGATYFYYRRERHINTPPVIHRYPLVSIIVPFYNEDGLLKENLNSLLTLA